MISYSYVESLNIENPFFVVIGAMDGLSHDNLSPLLLKNNYNGLFIEPVRYVFNKLIDNCKHNNSIILENCAITEEDGESEMFTIDFNKPQAYPAWSDGGSSLFPNRTAMKSVENLIKEKVKTHKLETVFKKHNITKVDILQIDCEGYDYIVFNQFDFNKYKPYFISIEIMCLPQNEIELILNKLESNNYKYNNNGSEVLAVRDEL